MPDAPAGFSCLTGMAQVRPASHHQRDHDNRCLLDGSAFRGTAVLRCHKRRGLSSDAPLARPVYLRQIQFLPHLKAWASLEGFCE